jgi:D-sedoheptulose 7-phosphate isomerase
MTGHDGGQLKESTRQTIIVPSEVTARIQEAHILIAHWWCQRADEVFTKEVYDAEN